MSVLKNKRSLSTMQYVQNACDIYDETLQFLSRLSARYSRLLAGDIIKLADEVVDNVVKADETYPSDSVTKSLRRRYLFKAKAAIAALDHKLMIVYELLIQNPQGAFTTSHGNAIPENDALRKLDHMAESLGAKLDLEEKLIRGTIEKDKSR